MRFDGFEGAWCWGLLVAMGITVVAMGVLLPIAARLGLVDRPTDRKNHGHETPAIGGVAMLIGIVAVLLGFGEWARASSAFVVAAVLLVATGWLDDRFDLRWWLRIGVQVAVALILIYGGGVRIEHLGPVFGIGDTPLGALSVPITVFATVGLINAMNMIDGVDGLAGTLVLATLLMVVAAAAYSGNVPLVKRSLVMAGAAIGFLIFNFRFPWRARAHAFMGNSGAALLGLVVAWSCFRLTQNEGHPVSPVLALWLAPVPVIDCLVLIARRMMAGRSPFSADHDHIHHIMRDAGFGPASTALGLAMFTGLCGLVIGQCLRLNIAEPLLLAAYGLLLAFWFALTAKRSRAVAFFKAARFWGRFLPETAQAGSEAARNEA